VRSIILVDLILPGKLVCVDPASAVWVVSCRYCHLNHDYYLSDRALFDPDADYESVALLLLSTFQWKRVNLNDLPGDDDFLCNRCWTKWKIANP
jgi:hypothetical protein